MNTLVYADSARVDDFNSSAPLVIGGPGELILRGGLVLQEDNWGLEVSPAAVRLGGTLSVQGTFQPAVTEFFGSTTQWVPTGGSANLADVIASGADVGFLNADLSGSLFVTGTASFDADGGFTMNVGDDVIVSGSGTFGTTSNTTVNIAGNLETQDLDTVSMGSPGEVINVGGDAIFGGGSTDGLLAAGELKVGGNFTQSGATATSFAPSVTHRTRLLGTAAQTVSFASSGSSASRFGILDIINHTLPVNFSTDAYVLGTLTLADTSGAPPDTVVAEGTGTVTVGGNISLGTRTKLRPARVGIGSGLTNNGTFAPVPHFR